MDLQVVIVNWNSGQLLGRLMSCLETLPAHVRQVLVVDNASTDGSTSVLEGRPEIELLALDRNLGFAAAANRGIEQSISAWVLLLNPDIAVTPGTIRQLYEQVQAMPEVGLACVTLLGEGGSSQAAFQIRRLPSVRSVLSDVLFLDELTGVFRRAKGEPAGFSSSAVPRAPVVVEQPAAAFWLIRRSAWSALGGFDEEFWPAWFEDVDFCRRLAKTPWHPVLFPQLKATHVGGHSLKALAYGHFLDYYYGNMLRYLRKHHPFAYPFLWPAVKLGIALRKLPFRNRARSGFQRSKRVP